MNLSALLKNFIIAISLVAATILYQGSPFSMTQVINALFIFGLLFTILGLFRITQRLHFYDLAVYSTKKFAEVLKTKNYDPTAAKLGSYYEYATEPRVYMSYIETLLTGLLLIAVSVLLLFI